MQLRVLILLVCLNTSPAIDSVVAEQIPKAVARCDTVRPVIEEYGRKHGELPADPSVLGSKWGKIAHECNYSRDVDNWVIGPRDPSYFARCNELFERLNEFKSRKGFLPYNLSSIAPDIQSLIGPCKFERGAVLEYSMEIEGGPCSMDLTGGCASRDCRTDTQKALDAAGVLRPPIGKSLWSYSSRFGHNAGWGMSCRLSELPAPESHQPHNK